MKSRHLPFYTKHLSFFYLHLIYIHASKSFSTQTCCYSVNIIFDHLITVIPPSALDDKNKENDLDNEFSDNEDEMTDSQKTNKLSDIYSTTVPSVDSAMESWDGSGIDAGYSSQGEFTLLTTARYSLHLLTASVKHDLMLLRRCLHPSGRWDCATPSRVA